MKKTMKIISSDDNEVEFDNGLRIYGEGDVDCCAYNYLDFEQLPVGTELPAYSVAEMVENMTVKEDGFSVKDADGVPKWVQARSDQNGYYSNMTGLFVSDGKTTRDFGSLSGDL